ncbi:MAG: Fe-S cluster assembly ATPase SufC [Legionellales bacterium]|jgi:Fe-S cluster assembly ATP-binding protein
MLNIENLYASVDGKQILKGLNLTINPGEVHAIMGPNGAGKSTLANVLAGRAGYEVTSGNIFYKNKSLLDMSVDLRAREGLFLAFQYPVEIPGVSNISFLKAAMNAKRRHREQTEMDAMDFLAAIKSKAKQMQMNEEMLYRAVNEGFSGGEKKRNEVLQMLMLEPCMSILDETDSGLDIDALQVVAQGVNALRANNRSFLVITHYQRLLNYIVPDFVHVLADGKIIKSGDKQLAIELEESGYVGVGG